MRTKRYSGTLDRDDVAQKAYLASGSDRNLMMMDSNPPGPYDPAGAFEAWQYFSSQGIASGSEITVKGFRAYSGNELVLHVARID